MRGQAKDTTLRPFSSLPQTLSSFLSLSRISIRVEKINLIILLTLNQGRKLDKARRKEIVSSSPFVAEFFQPKECFNSQCQHTQSLFYLVCVRTQRGVARWQSLGSNGIQQTSLVNSAKLGRQGTKILVHILINYTICDAILVCFSCLPPQINVINCMRNPTVVSERRLDQV